MPHSESSAAKSAAEGLAMLSQASHSSTLIPEDDSAPPADPTTNENARGGQQHPSTANAASSAAVGDLVVLEALPPKPIILTAKPKPKALKDKVTVPTSVKIPVKVRGLLEKANSYIGDAVRFAESNDAYAKSLLKESQGHIDSLHKNVTSLHGKLKKSLENNATLKLSINDANLKVEAANREKKAAEDAKGKLVKQLKAAASEVKRAKESAAKTKETAAKKPKEAAQKAVSQTELLQERSEIRLREYEAKKAIDLRKKKEDREHENDVRARRLESVTGVQLTSEGRFVSTTMLFLS
jgi:hypothetical protein